MLEQHPASPQELQRKIIFWCVGVQDEAVSSIQTDLTDLLMESQSLPSSPASMIPSVLEQSDDDENQSRSDSGDESVNYEEDQFESEDEHEHKQTQDGVGNSSSEKYASDEFEDEQESAVALEADMLESRGDSEENDYENESFERDEPEVATSTQIDEHGDTGGKQQSPEKNIGDEVQIAFPALVKDFDPQLGTWCSKKIQELNAVKSKPRSRQPRLFEAKSLSDKVPTAAVENLIHRIATSNLRYRPHQRHHSLWRPHHNLKAPTSLMQRVQTQLWLAKASHHDGSTAIHRLNKSATDPLPTSAQSVVPTFCSVKREKVLGQLATIQFSETMERWASSELGNRSLKTLDFVQTMAVEQRKICVVSGAADEPGGRMLHRVATSTHLQLEDSIALRHQANTILGRQSA